MLAVAAPAGPAGPRVSAHALAVARTAADRLLDRAEPQQRGVGWRTTMTSTAPLTGFSHGAAGIGWALLRYAAATGDERCARTGREAFRYERGTYRPELGNWPDFRVLDDGEPAATPPDPRHSMHAWCHGSPGIALARAAAVGWTADPDITADLTVAVDAMLAAPGMANHSLCHGELGNLEALAVARRAGRHDVAGEWNRRARAVVDDLAASGPRCGTPNAIQTPGLLAGLAGIGHGLLRLGFADRVPSALLLDPAGPA
jgi:lantibiotic modifying enzyme